ncbi:MAG: site-specific integrase [Actinomycetota bacterium]|nr:site-specific integrase [Actinomycetota bacterium]
MAKRGNGEGSKPRKRPDGRWEARYTVQTGTGTKRPTVYGKTRAEVSTKLTKALADRDGGLIFDDEGAKVGAFLDRWLKDSVRDTVRASTFERCESIANLHIKPVIGHVKLKNLKPDHVAALYRDRLDAGLSPATVNKIHVVLHKALKLAVRWGKVPRNATEAVTPPRPAPDEVRPLDSTQVATLLSGASGDRLEALYVLAVTTGARQGELLALKWEDVDLDGRKLHIRRTLTRSKGTMTVGEPKTKKSRRTIPLTRRAAVALTAHRARQNEEKLRASYRAGIPDEGKPPKHNVYEDRGLVFATKNGGIINPSNLRNRSFAKLLKRAKLPETTRFHDLRHTCATIMLKAGQHPKLVQELLGHATIAITLDTYSHVLPGMGDGLADAMDDAIGG